MEKSLIKPVLQLPFNFGDQPAVVDALDDIRFSIDDETLAEFAWFAREYPRIFRYHIYHTEHRLKTIQANYQIAASQFEKQLTNESSVFSITSGRGLAWHIYWDFEAFLNAVSSALDILARIVGLFYSNPTPLTFNKLCSKSELAGAVDILRSAQRAWVFRLKDYRDCFVHYTPVDNESYIHCRKYTDGWEVRCSLPINPNVREIDGFCFSRRVELLRYAIAVYKHLLNLDQQIGKLIRREWAVGAFPRRVENLFFVGERQRRSANQGLTPPAPARRR
jgi:hypothetical protein